MSIKNACRPLKIGPYRIPRNEAASHFVCKHYVFIYICVSWYSIFSNKVDLSQARNVLIYTRSAS